MDDVDLNKLKDMYRQTGNDSHSLNLSKQKPKYDTKFDYPSSVIHKLATAKDLSKVESKFSRNSSPSMKNRLRHGNDISVYRESSMKKINEISYAPRHYQKDKESGVSSNFVIYNGNGANGRS